MTKTELKERLFELSPKDQLEIQKELWERLQPNVDLRLTPELQALLKERVAEAKAHPDKGIMVEDAHAQIREDLT